MLVLPDADLRCCHSRLLSGSCENYTSWKHVSSRQIVHFLNEHVSENINKNCVSTATIGTLILFLTSLPVSLENGAGWPGLLVALIIIGLGYVKSTTLMVNCG
jgi:hypothetical protein